jgi:hypothetical protein
MTTSLETVLMMAKHVERHCDASELREALEFRLKVEGRLEGVKKAHEEVVNLLATATPEELDLLGQAWGEARQSVKSSKSRKRKKSS